MSFDKKLRQFIAEYEQLHGNSGPLQSREIAAWLLREHKCQPSIEESVDILARQVSRAMRGDYFTDPDGRRVRRKHSVRYKDTLEDGRKVQLTFWWGIELAPPDFMRDSFQQRRLSIADDCWQLKQDLDCYNKFYNKADPLQAEFDFRDDMADREAAGYQPPPDDED
jgi:hypothetical protein